MQMQHIILKESHLKRGFLFSIPLIQLNRFPHLRSYRFFSFSWSTRGKVFDEGRKTSARENEASAAIKSAQYRMHMEILIARRNSNNIGPRDFDYERNGSLFDLRDLNGDITICIKSRNYRRNLCFRLPCNLFSCFRCPTLIYDFESLFSGYHHGARNTTAKDDSQYCTVRKVIKVQSRTGSPLNRGQQINSAWLIEF